jgi:hypothetical protein
VPATPPEPLAQPARIERDWYGYQTLIVDALALSVLGVVVASEDWDGLFPAYAAYVLATPIVHLANWRPEAALASAGLRLLSPFLALGIVAMTTTGVDGGGSSPSPAYSLTLLSIGFAVPVAVDAAALAWKREPRPDALALRVRVNPRAAAAMVTVGGEL